MFEFQSDSSSILARAQWHLTEGRPEDVILHGAGARSPGAIDSVKEPENCATVSVSEMEFLGSFWRARLSGEQLGAIEIDANFSINAVRRMELAVGRDLVIEIPSDRLKLFAWQQAGG